MPRYFFNVKDEAGRELLRTRLSPASEDRLATVLL
jgi:hypothetical protein